VEVVTAQRILSAAIFGHALTEARFICCTK
jgi:hypothetical protein